ncbi:hypothetical protein NZK35_33045 [Stieleria sp. ICT_E10.1]|uniref:hypothetical protein n=1 Tax=Stieleria sedimenti TaxID=2976331 RepID=UPI00218042CA|nr:hypothetical protein [Stieleria sedimenti]MCS7471501.1 hypothetical protein [Stieleria sedimenti]
MPGEKMTATSMLHDPGKGSTTSGPAKHRIFAVHQKFDHFGSAKTPVRIATGTMKDCQLLMPNQRPVWLSAPL